MCADVAGRDAMRLHFITGKPDIHGGAIDVSHVFDSCSPWAGQGRADPMYHATVFLVTLNTLRPLHCIASREKEDNGC